MALDSGGGKSNHGFSLKMDTRCNGIELDPGGEKSNHGISSEIGHQVSGSNSKDLGVKNSTVGVEIEHLVSCMYH